MADVNKIKLPDNSEYNIKDYRIPGIDTTPISGSENLITSGGVHKDIEDVSLVVSTALNDLNIRVSEIEGTSSVSQSDYDNDQEIIATALVDLDSRINNIESLPIVNSSFDSIPTENSTNLVNSGSLYTVITQNELVTGVALNDLNDRLSNAENTINNNNYITTEIDPTVPAWAKASTKPTYTASEIGAQETLISGTNIKTINNESLLGSGNITISGGSGGEANVIEAVTFNGTPATITNKTAAITATIPAAQVQSDWNATSGMGVILNKPDIPTIESLTTSEIDTIWNNTL